MWNSTGTVSVTNGSPVVTGAGTVFSFPNAQPGQAFVGPNGFPMEIASVDSASQITLARAYGGATAAGQPFTILPTQSFANDLALAFAGFKNVAGAMLDTIGQGMFPDGAVAAPGIRFAADQDTGLWRFGPNLLSLVAGGVEALRAGGGQVASLLSFTAQDGIVAQRSGAPSTTVYPLDIFASAGGSASSRVRFGSAANGYATHSFFEAQTLTATASDLRFGTSGSERMRLTDNGNLGVGTVTPAAKAHVNESGNAPCYAMIGNPTGMTRIGVRADGASQLLSYAGQPLLLGSDNLGGVVSEWARFDAGGNLLVGATSGASSRFAKPDAAGEGIKVLGAGVASGDSFHIYSAFGSGASGSAAAVKVHANGATGRSINTGGTINASGADYAEYVRKSLACGTILKGDVCGIDINGQLTRTWADARRYVVKSTDPNLVGGDTWAAHLGPRPEAPLYDAPAYDGPAEPTKPVEPAAFVPPVIEVPVQPARADGEDDEAYLLRLAAFLNDRNATIAQAQAAAAAQIEAAKAQAAYVAAVDQYQADLAAYRDAQAAYRTAVDAAEAAHAVALAAHGEALTAWEAALEAARQTVDRIAFSGQVPVNVDADTLAACEAALGDGVAVYLVAVANGDGIGATAVRETDMTLPLYMRRLGAVWAIRDGRPWVDVQHG
ncbi:hypothetical protein [Sphingomonas sp. TX0522]|uniref:hypothetical protein n=1 Tax=Sphingomonas sp. TX0522 TaxID=2479205 RepID=UPI0018E04327|nr:hypothetical protein [Sphingomonas sp. TX0522]MBI0533252.1 hypothetical protein [Sphingomonas sp. TX0522]